jgi:hypothetical protein
MTKLTGIFTVNIINGSYVEITKSVNGYNEYIIINDSLINVNVNGIYVEKSFIESHKDFFKKIRSI